MVSTSVIDFQTESGEQSEDAVKKPVHRSQARSQATRYLSAAAYRNRRFRERVISEVLDAKHKAIAPNHGLDLAVVAGHCLRARRLKTVSGRQSMADLAPQHGRLC